MAMEMTKSTQLELQRLRTNLALVVEGVTLVAVLNCAHTWVECSPSLSVTYCDEWVRIHKGDTCVLSVSRVDENHLSVWMIRLRTDLATRIVNYFDSLEGVSIRACDERTSNLFRLNKSVPASVQAAAERCGLAFVFTGIHHRLSVVTSLGPGGEVLACEKVDPGHVLEVLRSFCEEEEEPLVKAVRDDDGARLAGTKHDRGEDEDEDEDETAHA